MPIDILEERVINIKNHLEIAERKLSQLEDNALIGENSPTYIEMHEAKKQVRTLQDALLKTQLALDSAYLNREKNPRKY